MELANKKGEFQLQRGKPVPPLLSYPICSRRLCLVLTKCVTYVFKENVWTPPFQQLTTALVHECFGGTFV